MKQRLTSEDIYCIVPILNNLLDGSYLVQIYDGSQDNTRILILKLRKKIEFESKIYFLLIESGIRIHLIDSFHNIRDMPSGMVSKFRRELKERRLYPINQIGNDRTLDFKFSNDKHFIVELYDKGNFIITDEFYKIIFIVRPYELNNLKIYVDNIYPIEQIININPKIDMDISNSKGYYIEKQTYSPFPIEGKNVKILENINEAIKLYYNTNIQKQVKKNPKESRLQNKKLNIQNQVDKMSNNEEKLLNYANLLQDQVKLIQDIINIVCNGIKNKIQLNEIELFIKNNYNFSNIKLDHKIIKLDNYIIDYKKSAYKNLSKYYLDKKKVTLKKDRAIEIYNNTEDTVYEDKKEKLIVNRKHMKFEDHWWFIYSDFIIICGKTADDNEKILNNVESNDIIIHGNFEKSPWCVIKNPKKLEIPIKVICYAGAFVVQRSWNWIENCNNNSYYTYPNKISKSTPSGEYMGKGSRMVHEKNYISNTEMEMGIGIIFKFNETYFGKLNIDSKIDFAMIICAPYNSINDFDFRVKVKPNPLKNDRGRKKKLELIKSRILKTKTNHKLVKEYIKAILYEEWDKTSIRTFVL